MRHPDDTRDGPLEQQLRAALHHRAALAPDADEVLRTADAVGTLRRRRRQQVGAGAALAVAGLTAFAVPRVDDVLRAVRPEASWVAGRPDAPPASAEPAPTAPTPRAGAVPWTLPEDEAALAWWRDPTSAVDFDADLALVFTNAGYDYDDAVALAELWGHPGDVDYAKVTAGTELLAGEPLPFPPGSSTPQVIAGDAWDAFTAAGLGVDDAQDLAALWDLPSGFQAAERAGELLVANRQLPQTAPAAEDDESAVSAFTGAGHGYDEALELAELWGLAGADEAKVAAGDNLLAGRGLPLQP